MDGLVLFVFSWKIFYILRGKEREMLKVYNEYLWTSKSLLTNPSHLPQRESITSLGSFFLFLGVIYSKEKLRIKIFLRHVMKRSLIRINSRRLEIRVFLQEVWVIKRLVTGKRVYPKRRG